MRRLTWYGIAFTVTVALLLVPSALAARGAKGAERMSRMADALDLTAEQRAQMRQIVEKYQDGALAEHRRAAREARRELHRVVHDVTATDAQVQEAAREVASHEAFVAVERHRMTIEIDRILTDAQREKAAELRGRRGERRGKRDLE